MPNSAQAQIAPPSGDTLRGAGPSACSDAPKYSGGAALTATQQCVLVVLSNCLTVAEVAVAGTPTWRAANDPPLFREAPRSIVEGIFLWNPIRTLQPCPSNRNCGLGRDSRGHTALVGGLPLERQNSMEVECLETNEEDAADLLNHFTGVLSCLRSIAAEAKLEQVADAINIAYGEIVAIAITREAEKGPAPPA